MKRIFAAAALLALATGGAQAASDFATAFFGTKPGPGKTFACFTRVYDATHLASHPQQNVKTMALLAVADSENADVVDVRVAVNFRKAKRLLQTAGSCGSVHGDNAEGGVPTTHCGVDCDGGAIDVALKTNGSVLVGIPDGARLWTPGSDAPDDSGRRQFGADDKLFRLDRAALNQCLPLANDAAEKARLRRGK